MWKNRLNKIVALSGVLGLSLTALSGCGKEESIYRETTVEYGVLSVGITESGSVDIGTVEQTFELNMNALQRVEISSNTPSRGNSSGSGMTGGFSGGGMNSGMGGGISGSMPGMSGGMGGSAPSTGGSGMSSNSGANSGGAGAMDMFSQVFNMAGGNSVVSGENTSELIVSEVCVTIGEKVEEGDILYLLDEEAVAELSQELESNVEKARADLDAVIADQNLTKTTAEYTQKISVAYGSYAELEKEMTINSLKAAVTEKEEALADAKDTLKNYKDQLSQTKAEYNNAVQAQKNMEWSRDNLNKSDSLYLYTVYAQNAISASQMVASYEQEMEQLESKIGQAQSSVTQAEKNLASANRSLESGKLSAQETYELRKLAYDTAEETYNITVAYLEDDLVTQQEIYEEATEKWNEFSSHIDGNAVRSKYSGVITSVNLAVGDSLGTGASLVALYDVDEVSMTVTLNEEDMTDIVIGGLANISFVAYPDDIYVAEVTEISDASTDTSGNTTYEVTATISEKGETLFQGMTGKITFVTRESEEVLYVSNRAIIREGKKSYVKIKDKNGNIKKTEVVTGFSDGVNVEIIKGLSLGDVVLIESKVNAG